MKPVQQDIVRSILVRSPNWIGDQVLAYPFFYHLRKTYPRAKIAVACVPWVQAIQFRDLIDEVHLLPQPQDRSLMARWKALEEGAARLRTAGAWDLAYLMPNSFSSAWLAYRAGARRRVGFATDGRGFLLTDKLKWTGAREEAHRSQTYVDLLGGSFSPATEFWGVPAENDLDQDMPGELKEFDAARAWSEAQIVEPPFEAGKYWVLAPGSNAESRRWPLESFASLARDIASSSGLPGLIVGGFAEMPLAEELCSDRALKLRDLTGKGSVASLWKVFRGARFTVSNDSGLAHVASLCGSPVQVVWGAGKPGRTRPLGPGKTRVALNPVECWPCERNTCALPPGRKIECLRGIRADGVWEEIQNGLLRV